MNAMFKIERMPSGHGASPVRPQVVALHGSASTGAQWRRLVGELAADYDVVRPDLPGYGRQQTVVLHGAPSLDGDASELGRIAQEASAPIHLVAHSYGAAVAFKFALDHPDRVASLTLIEPVLFHLLRTGETQDMVHYTEISSVANAVRMAAQFGMPAKGMARFIDYWNGAGAWDAMKSSLQAALAGQIAQVARNFTAAFAETWEASEARRITCPTLIIAAEKSRGPAKRVAEILAAAMPQAGLHTVAGVGHMAPLTHPERINPLIAEALAAATPDRTEVSHREAA